MDIISFTALEFQHIAIRSSNTSTYCINLASTKVSNFVY